MAVLQTGIPVGSPLAYLVTFAVAAAFYALTAHVAARWVIGETPLRSAIEVGVGPAIVTLVTVSFQPLGTPIVFVLAVLVDAVAIKLVYDENSRVTVLFTVVHVLVSVALGLAFVNLARLLL